MSSVVVFADIFGFVYCLIHLPHVARVCVRFWCMLHSHLAYRTIEVSDLVLLVTKSNVRCHPEIQSIKNKIKKKSKYVKLTVPSIHIDKSNRILSTLSRSRPHGACHRSLRTSCVFLACATRHSPPEKV